MAHFCTSHTLFRIQKLKSICHLPGPFVNNDDGDDDSESGACDDSGDDGKYDGDADDDAAVAECEDRDGEGAGECDVDDDVADDDGDEVDEEKGVAADRGAACLGDVRLRRF